MEIQARGLHPPINDVTAYDDPETRQDPLPGKVTWLAGRSEFTPKIIQTREERVNLVYAVKVEVPNDGRLKIGMPGEVIFSKPVKE